MKTWRLLLLSILCCGALGGWWMIGCGSDADRCTDTCNKINECGALILTGTASVDACKNNCLDNLNKVECVLNCDPSTSCVDLATCIQGNCLPL